MTSNIPSKRSGPLSPIDSISLCKPSNIKQCPDENVFEKQIYNDQPLLLANDNSHEVHLFSEHSNHDLQSSIHEASQNLKIVDDVPCIPESFVCEDLPKISKKKQKKRVDPALEKQRQNYGYYQHF